MTKLTLPFKGMKVASITQFYSEKHKALDIVNGGSIESYGTPLCAPEKCKVLAMKEGTFTPGNVGELERGYGIFLRGLETGLVHEYWHTLPILPVNVGEVVARGRIVAFMGNAGNVFTAGVYVPISERGNVDKKGTHLHYEVMEKYIGGKKKNHKDPLPLLNWASEPKYTIDDLKKAQKVVFEKIKVLMR